MKVLLTKGGDLMKWDQFASIYDFLISGEENAYYDIKHRIVGSLNNDDRVLEVASGSGEMAIELCPHCKIVHATDISQVMLNKAIEKSKFTMHQNISFEQTDVCNMKYPDNSYDVVIISNALHILPDPYLAIKEIYRVLKPGGRFIAPTFLHNENIKSSILSNILGGFGYKTYHKWNEQDYHDFIRSHNFYIRRTALVDATIPIAYVEAIKDKPDARAPIFFE